MFLKTGVDIYTYISLVNFPSRTKICGNGLFNPLCTKFHFQLTIDFPE